MLQGTRDLNFIKHAEIHNVPSFGLADASVPRTPSFGDVRSWNRCHQAALQLNPHSTICSEFFLETERSTRCLRTGGKSHRGVVTVGNREPPTNWAPTITLSQCKSPRQRTW